jgi:hypothetical protein
MTPMLIREEEKGRGGLKVRRRTSDGNPSTIMIILRRDQQYHSIPLLSMPVQSFVVSSIATPFHW